MEINAREQPQQTSLVNQADPFPAVDFDHWAQTYDQDVQQGGFPFDGYTQVLETTLRLAEVKPGQSILDLGVGTGNLAQLFAQRDCLIFGIDYSDRMLELARVKLPGAVLCQADLRRDWPVVLEGPFDRIVSAYVFHHFDLAQKVALLRQLSAFLALDGWMVIADLAFRDLQSMETVRQTVGLAWEDEYYWIAEETLPALMEAGFSASFWPVSSCAGVFVISRS